MKKPIRRGIILFNSYVRGGGILFLLGIVALIGLGFSSFLIVSDSYTYSEYDINAKVGDITTSSGSSLLLDESKGDSEGLDSLKYVSTDLTSGLVYEETIGNKGSIKYYFYLKKDSFKSVYSTFNYISLELSLSYSSSISDVSNFTLLNSSTSGNLNYINNNIVNSYSSSSLSSSILTSSYSSNIVTSISSNIPIEENGKNIIHFELEYVFTVSDASKVIENECKYTSNLFNLKIKINEGK